MKERVYLIERGFHNGDNFLVFPLLIKQATETYYDNIWRSFRNSKENASMFAVDSETVHRLLEPVLKELFDPSLEANRDVQNPCTFANQTTCFEWYGENTYTIDACNKIIESLQPFDTENSLISKFIVLLSEIIEKAKTEAGLIVFDGP